MHPGPAKKISKLLFFFRKPHVILWEPMTTWYQNELHVGLRRIAEKTLTLDQHQQQGTSSGRNFLGMRRKSWEDDTHQRRPATVALKGRAALVRRR